jgi:hypothetical protein
VASEDPVARTIAGASLLVSLSSLLWTIHIGRRDNPSIKLRVEQTFLFRGSNSYGPYVTFTITNRGRRPTTIREVGFLGGQHKRIAVFPLEPTILPIEAHDQNLPGEVAENKKLAYFLPAKPFSDKHKADLGEPPLGYVIDVVDRMYTAKLPPVVLGILWPGAQYPPTWKFWKFWRRTA